MCKISFAKISDQNLYPKGLLQFNLLEEYFQEVISLQNENCWSKDNFTLQKIEVFDEKVARIENEIFNWFQKKSIRRGNPEEIIVTHVEKQKAMIIPKKAELHSISGIQIKKSNLMSRRKVNLLQVNVAG